jgi:hypothetical protein
MNRIIPQFDCDELDDAGPRFADWVANLKRYLNIKQVTTDSLKQDYLFLYGGQGLVRIYKQVEDAADNFDAIITKLKAHFNPVVNYNLNTFQFRRMAQREAEPFDDYVARLREKASTCNFGNDNDRQLIFQIITGCRDESLKEEALAKPDINLNDLITLGRTKQTVASQLKEMATNRLKLAVTTRLTGATNNSQNASTATNAPVNQT